MIGPCHAPLTRIKLFLAGYAFSSCLALLHSSAATLVVTNTSDSGAGSLRQAILNATNGADTIAFQIPGAGVHTISPASTLPALTEPVVIDGTTQPGYAGTPLVELNGASAGNNAGLRLLAGGSTVRGLAINRFLTDAISISGPGSNLVAGNFLGTDPTGLIARGNAQEGVLITGSGGNVIGGSSAADRNLISGNTDAGVYILNGSGNTVLGNYIGTTITGAARLPNANNGVAIYGATGSAAGNQIGGALAAARNVISGNGGSGVNLVGAGASGNVIQGNYLGTDVSGTLSISNVGDGITISGAVGNFIGGVNAGQGNLISGNAQAGVSLSSASAGNNLVQGNLIGTDLTGRLALPNIFAGVTIYAAGGNQVGGASAGARNVVSGNKQDGIFISAGSSGNTIQGNFIGVSVAGTNALPNLFNGVSISGGAANTVGGAAVGAGNIISGNAGNGVEITNATGNAVLGNFIGTDFTGQHPVGNQLCGLRLESPSSTVGGIGAGNVISANGLDGIFLAGAPAVSNVIQGNFIGTTATGVAGLGNGRAGVGISGAPGNTLGGAAPGAGNVLSANNDAGIYLISPTAAWNQIQGNTIGADVSGTLPLGNTYEGIYLERAPTNTIGGTTAGAGNLISGNNTRGIWLTNASWNLIQGNRIGTKSDGVSALGNVFHSVECEIGATNNTIGGTAAGAGNTIAFAQSIYAGVRIRNGATNDAILGNAIFSNGALGIDLGAAGVNVNVACDAATGANMAQNFPVLTQAVSGNAVGVRGTLNSRAGKTYLLQFFASPSCDGSGNGEGQVYLGGTSVTTGGDCNASFVATFAKAVPVGYAITATATDAANNTSEFSACLPTSAAPALTVVPAANHQITLAWPNSTTGFALWQTPSLAPAQWTAVTNVPVNLNGQFSVTLPLTTTNRFFVLNFQ